MTAIGLVWSDSANFSLSEPAGAWSDAVLGVPSGLCPLATATQSRIAWLAAAVITITPALDPLDEGLIGLSVPTGAGAYQFTTDPSGTLGVAGSGAGSVLSTGTHGLDPNGGGSFSLHAGGTSQPYDFTGSIAAALWYDDQPAGGSTGFNTQVLRIIPTLAANTGVDAGGTFTTSPTLHPPTFIAQGVFSGAVGHNNGGASTPVFDPSWTTIISHTSGNFYAALAWVPGPYTDPQTFTWSLGGNSSVDWGLLDPGEMLYDFQLPAVVATTRSFAVVIG